MVTFAFILLVILLTILIALFDMSLFEFSFFEAMKNILYSEIAIGRYIALFGAVLGLISSVIIDFRIHRSKKESNADERTQG
ncbi:hypothetical protein [Neobacillus niacini]|uniref:hypothetical protein n=1 Tax=Neobacillus niacini TaxID=86668 RepID=UPI002041FBB5|nr:hypothetical protein [Neobacillus niacini]MCM3690118.1 hypothetical protein [Neobacillus niacini]